MHPQQAETEKILVVDDEKSMREFLEIMLQKDGFEVTCAESGEEALTAIRREKFDLLITDIRMKPIDGLEVLRQCKSISPSTAVIIISAYASAETAVVAMKEGAYDYLPKPFKIDEMRTAITNALLSKKDEECSGRPSGRPSLLWLSHRRRLRQCARSMR